MERNNVDPVYGYVDNKVKLLKRELQQLKIAHDAVASEQKQALLATQKTISAFIAVSTFSMFATNTPKKLQSQISSLAGAARAKIDTSDEPLSITAQYYNKCLNLLEENGIDTIYFR